MAKLPIENETVSSVKWPGEILRRRFKSVTMVFCPRGSRSFDLFLKITWLALATPFTSTQRLDDPWERQFSKGTIIHDVH